MSIWNIFFPDKEELEVIEALKKYNYKSMRISSRGGLSMDAREVRDNPRYKELLTK